MVDVEERWLREDQVRSQILLVLVFMTFTYMILTGLLTALIRSIVVEDERYQYIAVSDRALVRILRGVLVGVVEAEGSAACIHRSLPPASLRLYISERSLVAVFDRLGAHRIFRTVWLNRALWAAWVAACPWGCG